MDGASRTHARGFIPPDLADAEVSLSELESSHLARVLRVRVGDRIEWFDGRGAEGEAEVLAAGKKTLRIRRLSSRRVRPPQPEIVLLPAVLREGPMDMLLQKAVELGVTRIQPVLAERGVVRLEAGQAESRRARWETIVLNAARQCRTAWFPRVEPPRPLAEILAEKPGFDLFLACLLADNAIPLSTALRAAAAPGVIGVAVGPEGDFSPAEEAELRRAGATAVRLGPRVLRAETASLHVLSVLQFVFGDGAPGRVP